MDVYYIEDGGDLPFRRKVDEISIRAKAFLDGKWTKFLRLKFVIGTSWKLFFTEMYHNQVTNIELLGTAVAVNRLFISHSGSFQMLAHNRVIMKDSFSKVVIRLAVRVGQGNEVMSVVGKLRVDQGEWGTTS
ncbi:hypothetical protein PanWU01x14_088210 [Parasponia andersonii]|uniref:Uncharacterized protein n=1 Tax=Parasponia andersonii TaxID=3476 RepID=A0A2P5D7V8_PARAD|nr:hypothetical protein PanWU01x14_088210 [Parasponia andersonii]